jgi:hypothetical protein
VMIPIHEGYSLDNDGLLRYNGKIYVPPNEKLRKLILREDHQVVYMAHPEVMWMKEYLKPLLFWKGMKTNIFNYVAKCLEYQ